MRIAVILLAVAAVAPAQKRPIQHEDVWTMKRVSSLALSPDGKWAVVSVNEPAYDTGKARSDLWIVPTSGAAAPRRLTGTKGGETGAVFSPDSKNLAFAAKREGDDEAQIYVLPLDGGEARRWTQLTTGASSPRWHPGGKAIAFESTVYPGARTEADNRKAHEEKKARKYNVRTYETFPFRHWNHFLDEFRPHVFVLDLKDGAEPRDLLAGTRMVAEPGFEGVQGLAGSSLQADWTPAGDAIVFSAALNTDRSISEPLTTHLYRVSLTGGEPVAITSGADSYSDARFTPDGKTLLALEEHSAARQLYSLARVVRIPWTSSTATQFPQPQFVTSGWDRSVSQLAVSPDSRTLWLTAEDAGHDKVFTVPLAGGTPAQAFEVKEGTYSALAMGGTASAPVVAGLWGSMVSPENVVVLEAGKGHRMLTDFHRDAISRIDWQPPRHFWFEAKNGKRIHSLLVLPPGFDESKKYPLVVFPHGGPHNMTKDQFFVRWNYHLLTSPGYVMLMTNYTGSTGFGEEFALAIHKDVLRGPGREIEEAADAAVKQFAFIDGSRQAAIGASYGGYLMNWFAGNTKRFKCLVNHAGLTDHSSFWGATDSAYYWEQRYGGPVWANRDRWQEQSPAAFAGNFTTPMLVTHGERDYRVPVSQGYEIFKLLQRRGVPSRLVLFPEEDHWIQRGENARVHMREVLGWLAKYL